MGIMKLIFLKLINKFINLLLGNSGDCGYVVHFTSVVINGSNLKVSNGKSNRAVMKSFNKSISCYFNCINGVYLGDGVLFGPKVSIISANHNFNDNRSESIVRESDKIIIHDNVWLGVGVVVLPGVTIGKNSIIGANSTVVKNIPPNVVAVGSPARVISKLNNNG